MYATVRELPKNGYDMPAWLSTTQSTTNYSIFKLDARNRPIDPLHLSKLRAAIEKKNLLREYPIVVDRNMVVIDGQHRLQVAEMLNLPLYYTISEQATIEDVAETNSVTKRWDSHQYMHHWSASGKIEYLKLREFQQKYSWIQLSTAIRLCYFGDQRRGGGLAQAFAAGIYVANDIEFAERVANATLDFSQWIPFYANATFLQAVSHLLANAKYDHKRMLNKLSFLSARMVKCVDVPAYLALFTELYNWGARKDTIVIFKKLQHNDRDYRTDRKHQK